MLGLLNQENQPGLYLAGLDNYPPAFDRGRGTNYLFDLDLPESKSSGGFSARKALELEIEPDESVSGPSIGFEIKEGKDVQPEEYIVQIFRGLDIEPDAEIGLEGRS